MNQRKSLQDSDVNCSRGGDREVPILAMAPNSWWGPWMNRQQLLTRLAARGWPVFYSRGQWNVWELRSASWQQAPLAGSWEVGDGVVVDVPPRVVLRTPALPRLDSVALALTCRRLRQRLRRFRTGGIFYAFHPKFQPYAARLRLDQLVYHAYDLYEKTPGWREELAVQEDWLLQHAALRIASSATTAQRLSERSGQDVRVLANAADTAAFSPELKAAPLPEEFQRISEPRIGYVGSVNMKVDFGLIARLARRRPEWNLVIMGAEGTLDESTRASVAECRTCSNVFFLGVKPYSELPRFVVNLQAGLMPYRRGPRLWTDAISPLKLHEYLAADIPVVSTRLPAVEPFGAVLCLADSDDEWEAGIDHALKTGGVGVGQRRAVALANDWNRRVDQLETWLGELSEQAQIRD